MPIPYENYTPAQLTDKLLNLKKFEWGFIEAKRVGSFQFQLQELQELNQHYYEVFGSYNNIHCSGCPWVGYLIDWYNEHKTT